MPKVDLSFPVMGGQIPADHGYLAYFAVSRLLPAAHQADGSAIPAGAAAIIGLPVRRFFGQLWRCGRLKNSWGVLHFRLPVV